MVVVGACCAQAEVMSIFGRLNPATVSPAFTCICTCRLVLGSDNKSSKSRQRSASNDGVSHGVRGVVSHYGKGGKFSAWSILDTQSEASKFNIVYRSKHATQNHITEVSYGKNIEHENKAEENGVQDPTPLPHIHTHTHTHQPLVGSAPRLACVIVGFILVDMVSAWCLRHGVADQCSKTPGRKE